MSAASSTAPARGSARVARPLPGLSFRWRPRAAAVAAVLVGVVVVLLAVAIVVGDVPVPVPDVVAALLGRGEGSSAYIVTGLRLPRALVALLVGAALGMSGAVFQTVVRNPLGSPELIGFTEGSATGAVVGIVLYGLTGAALAGAAVTGGTVAAVLVWLLAYRRGVLGTRLVVVGIGIGAMANAVTWWLLSRAELTQAQTAAAWLIGSLNARGWTHVAVLASVLAVLLPLAVVAARWLRMIELGDQAARGLGLPFGRAQLLVVGLGVVWCAAAVAVAGPVPFVALAAPQVARRLVRGPGIGLGTTALVGAALLLAADVVAQRVGTGVPVGVMTGVLGGVYLAWLVAREGRRAGWTS